MTIGQVCAALNVDQPVKPKHALRVCPECGSDDLGWFEEHAGPYLDPDSGTGYDVEACNDCGTPTGRRALYGRVIA